MQNMITNVCLGLYTFCDVYRVCSAIFYVLRYIKILNEIMIVNI